MLYIYIYIYYECRIFFDVDGDEVGAEVQGGGAQDEPPGARRGASAEADGAGEARALRHGLGAAAAAGGGRHLRAPAAGGASHQDLEGVESRLPESGAPRFKCFQVIGHTHIHI